MSTCRVASKPRASSVKSSVKSKSGGAHLSRDRLGLSPRSHGDGRKRVAVTERKRVPAPSDHSSHNRQGPGFHRLVQARARLKSLEQNMSTLRHSAQINKARYCSECAALKEENSKLKHSVDALVARVIDFTQRLGNGQKLPPKDVWESRVKLTDEHPDDFLALAKNIERAKTVKDEELKRILAGYVNMEDEMRLQRRRRVSEASQATEMERQRRMQDSQGNATRRLSQRIQSLKLSESVPLTEGW